MSEFTPPFNNSNAGNSTRPSALSVSEFNRQVKRLLEVSYAQVWISGEISGLSKPRSGHWYFSLKDDKAQVRCAMFKGFNQRLRFNPKEGDQVIVRAKVSLYEGRGDFQLIVESMEPEGLGQLQAAFEELKQKLAVEGLFEERYKKAIPAMPHKVAVITSQTGAVIHDIISVSKRRFPNLEILLLPVTVQGEGSANQIAQAIQLANENNIADVLIVGRGGGSLEDLWSFNEEVVARAIFASQLPIISAVGHEVDYTIADLVADYRAPTPSAAAERITPDQFELMQQIDYQQRRLEHLIHTKIHQLSDKVLERSKRLKHPGTSLQEKQTRLRELTHRLNQSLKSCIERSAFRLNQLEQKVSQHSPDNAIQQHNTKLIHLQDRLQLAQKLCIEQKSHQLALLAQTLHTASPLATLGRGYAIVKSGKKVVTQCSQVKPGDKITTQLKDGIVESEVSNSHPSLEL